MNTPPSLNIDSPWGSAPARTGGTVLLVDDEPAILTIGRAILSTLPFTVQTAASGEEAIDKFRSLSAAGGHFDLVILDLTMPGGMSGLETLQEIRTLDTRCGIVACSGFFEQSAQELCAALGFMDIIEKPYTSEILTSMVRKCMARVLDPDAEQPARDLHSPADPELASA